MIYDDIKNITNYFGLNKNLDEAINYLKDLDFLSLLPGKNTVKGDEIFINRLTLQTNNEEQLLWESHIDYLDIHCCISNREKILISTQDYLNVKKPYDKAIDAQLYEGDTSLCSVLMQKGKFLICFPQDVHKVGVIFKNSEYVEKVVCKVKIS